MSSNFSILVYNISIPNINSDGNGEIIEHIEGYTLGLIVMKDDNFN